MISTAEVGWARPRTASGGVVNPETVAKWIRHGVRVGDRTVRLEGFRLGGRWVTTREAVERFVAALTAAKESASGR